MSNACVGRSDQHMMITANCSSLQSISHFLPTVTFFTLPDFTNYHLSPLCIYVLLVFSSPLSYPFTFPYYSTASPTPLPSLLLCPPLITSSFPTPLPTLMFWPVRYTSPLHSPFSVPHCCSSRPFTPLLSPLFNPSLHCCPAPLYVPISPYADLVL